MNSKKLIYIVFAVLFIMTSLSFSFVAFADDISYSYDSVNDVLKITGTGDMEDYNENYLPEWHRYAADCREIIIGEGITSIGSYAFTEFINVNCIDIPSGVTSINFGAFSRCDSLTYLYLPVTVAMIADTSFAYVGSQLKQGFVLYGDGGSYALHYAAQNSIPFDTDSILCGATLVNINEKSMSAYYKYTAKVDGTFRIYSSGGHDTLGVLYDSEFNVIKSNDDISESNANFSFNAELSKGSTYYIKTKLVSSGLTGSYYLRIAPVTYTLIFTVNAMLNKNGDASDIIITDALVNGVSCGGYFTETVTEASVVKTVTVGNLSRQITFTPDSDDKVVFMTVDVNGDGYVNAKDYSLMKRNNSPYISLFENFISVN